MMTYIFFIFLSEHWQVTDSILINYLDDARSKMDVGFDGESASLLLDFDNVFLDDDPPVKLRFTPAFIAAANWFANCWPKKKNKKTKRKTGVRLVFESFVVVVVSQD